MEMLKPLQYEFVVSPAALHCTRKACILVCVNIDALGPQHPGKALTLHQPWIPADNPCVDPFTCTTSDQVKDAVSDGEDALLQPLGLIVPLVDGDHLPDAIQIKNKVLPAGGLSNERGFPGQRWTVYQIYSLRWFMTEPRMDFVVASMMYQVDKLRIEGNGKVVDVLFC